MNFISFKTNYYTEKGGLQETRTIETIKKGAEYIISQYPNYCKMKLNKKGRYEIMFLKKAGVPAQPTENCEKYPICLPIEREFNLMNLRHKLLTKLNSTTIRPCEGLRRDLKPSRSTLLLENPDHSKFKGIKDRPSTFTLGYGRRRQKGNSPFSFNTTHSELYRLLIQYGEMILPEGFIFSTITINKNLKAKAHKDKGNVGVSALTTLGDYEKGGLFSEGKLYSTGETILMLYAII